MGSGSFVRLANDAVRSVEDAIDCCDTHYSQGCERHCERKKSAGVFQDGAKGIGIPVHAASLSWNDVLIQCRPYDVCRCAQATIAGLKKLLELSAIALSPGAGIETREQMSEARGHRASSLLSPALVNCCSVESFARRTRRPALVMR